MLAQDREAVERELDRAVALRRHDPEPPPLGPEHGEQLEHLVERLERLVERLVVLPVRLDQLVDAVGVEVAHLRDDARPADRRAHELLVGISRPRTVSDGVLHRGEDDRPGVDQRAVEVEEDDREAHAAIVARGRGSPR